MRELLLWQMWLSFNKWYDLKTDATPSHYWSVLVPELESCFLVIPHTVYTLKRKQNIDRALCKENVYSSDHKGYPGMTILKTKYLPLDK